MQNELLIALLSGLGGMIGWGFADFFAKKTIDKMGDVATLFWGQLIGVFPLLIIFFIYPYVPRLGFSSFGYLAFLGIWSGLSYIPTYVAFGKGKVSLLSPIFATNAVIVAVLSGLIFNEVIPFGRQLGFAVVFFGIILVNGDPRNIWFLLRGKLPKQEEKIDGLKEILFAVCVYSVWLLAFNHFVAEQYWVPFLLVVRIFSALALYLYSKFKHIALSVPDKSLWKYLVLIGIFDVAAFACISYGFSKTSYTSIVAMLGSIFSLPTIILARIFLKERMTRMQAVGSIIIILGIVTISLL